MIRFRELAREVEELRAELDGALAGVLDDGRFVLGERVERFEAAFAAFCGARHGIGVASGTDAIAVALRAVGVEPGDEVVAPANTCVPTIAGIERAGARPVLADVDPDTGTIDAADLARVITPATRAVVPVHLYGQCADMDAIAAVARGRGLAIVEDAAHAHGAEYAGRRAGTLGDAAAFSFYPTKNLGALGDAGIVVTDGAEVDARARLVREYGERGRYESVLAGWNSRLDSLQAAALEAKLPRLEGWNERRRELARRYDDALAHSTVSPLRPSPGRLHAYHLYVVRAPEREQLRARLARAGVETLVHYPRAVHEHPAYRRLAAGGPFPVSERLAAEVVSLPLYPQLTDDEADAVVAAVRG